MFHKDRQVLYFSSNFVGMKVIRSKDGTELDVQINRMDDVQLLALTNYPDLSFDWSLEVGNEVYQLSMLLRPAHPLGLMTVSTRKNMLVVYIDQIEATKPNRRREKLYIGVAGCLIAFACYLSFERGFNGSVVLEPKIIW